MDTLSHALSGALLARATESKNPRPDQLPRRTRMIIGFIASAFPDSDFILSFIDPLTYLTAHRGITHSVVLLPLWALSLAMVFAFLSRGKYRWRAFVGIVALGIGAHIAGDVITAFGTMIFAPFSGWRASLPTTFIIDLYFSAIIIAGLVASAVWTRSRRPAIIGLAVLVVYVGFQYALHQRAVGVGEAYAASKDIPAAAIHAIPQPFSPFNWMVVVQQPEIFQTAYISLWRDAIPPAPPTSAGWLSQVSASYYPVAQAQWTRIPRYGPENHAPLAQQAWQSEALAPYRHFTLLPAVYRVDIQATRQCVWFNDLRFALAGRRMPFRYGVCRDLAEQTWQTFRLYKEEPASHH